MPGRLTSIVILGKKDKGACCPECAAKAVPRRKTVSNKRRKV